MFAPGASPYLAFGAGALVAFGLVWGLAGEPLGVLPILGALPFVAVWGFFAAFFRDPERTPGSGVVSPADGRVRAVETSSDRTRISVFMNVTDVHVNRVPLDATFDRIESSGRGHRAAFADAAETNVQRSYALTTGIGPVEVVQITGALARRLVSFVTPGQSRLKGERFGMIVLGSRVDVYLPAKRVRVTTRVGDRVRAGETTIAEVIA